MIISWRELDASTLQNIIEYFVLREGTDYGESEKSLVEKVDEVKCQLQTGKAIIVWSESNETIDIIMKECVSSF